MGAGFPSGLEARLHAMRRVRAVLALDYDGTLAPFQVNRMAAVPDRTVLPPLQAIVCDRETRLVIVSGRPVAELEQLLPLEPLPELWGVHGWEQRLPDGSRRDHALPPETQAVLAQACTDVVDAGWRDQVEHKGATVALHWRGLPPDAQRAMEARVRDAWARLARAHALELRPFNGGLELRHPGRDKGAVIRDLLASERAGTPLAYVGDDDTDEDAFRALPPEGLGVRVASDDAPSAAAFRIRPGAVSVFLEAWHRAGVAARGPEAGA